MNLHGFSYHLILALLCFILVNAVGCLLVWHHVQDERIADLREKLNWTIEGIDQILAHAEDAASKSLVHVESGCDYDTQSRLARIQAAIPDVRSVNLVKDDIIFCSSLFGSIRYPVNPQDYAAGILKIFSGNKTTPDDALLVYRYSRNTSSVLIGINGYYLHHLLRIINTPDEVFLNVGYEFLDSSGHVSQQKQAYMMKIKSSRYPYMLFGTIKDSLQPIEQIRKEKWNLLATILFSTIISTMVFMRLRHRVTLNALLRQAFEKNQFTTYIQPITDARTGNIVGGEVLMRWQHPELGFIAPDKFIPVAEKSNMIILLTELSMAKIIAMIKQENLTTPLFICFNVSAKHFSNKRIIKLCKHFMEELCDFNIALTLEVTERENILSIESLELIVQNLRNIGVHFSIDDYGTGNANLSYVKKFTPDYIKIDKSFTNHINESKGSAVIIENIISLARGFSCKTIAEGVETAGQLKALKALGVDYIQGYFTGKPMTLSDFSEITNISPRRDGLP